MKKKTQPDGRGYFGEFGGQYIAEVLVPAVKELTEAYKEHRREKGYKEELAEALANYVGRPTPLYYAQRLSSEWGGRIYMKREDLCHTGSHKLNNVMGQILLAKRMGKKRIIAETGAGQHGVATATVCARYGLPCVVYMGAEDVRRQALNVYRMRLLGAEVIPVESGARTLKDAMNDALRDWVTNVEDTYYCIGTVGGPHPYPWMVRNFQSIIGREARKQILKQEGKLPDACIACVGGGSNAIGIFHAFLNDENVKLIGVEPAGFGLDTDKHGAPLCKGRPGVLHGSKSYLLDTDDGQIVEAHSISAGLDYPGVGPEHSALKDSGRANYVAITDDEALSAFHEVSTLEGIMPALESSHALGYTKKYASEAGADEVIIVNCSGRGDKDVHTVAEYDEKKGE